ncbi:hypothetical protein OG328_51375 [Streptomyces sp. NBC_01518]
MFGVSSSTVCRVIQRLGPLLAIEPVSRPAVAPEGVWIVDGTLIPLRGRRRPRPAATTGSRRTCRSSWTRTRGW